MSSTPRSNLSQEAIREFLVETQESVEQVEADLVELESNPNAADASSTGVGRMFRMLHSIKGSCGFLGYPKLEELAHVGENLLGRIRDGILPIDTTVTTALLSIVDAIREVLDHIESENDEGNQDYSSLTNQLSQVFGSDDDSESAAADGLFAKASDQGADASDQPQDDVDEPDLKADRSQPEHDQQSRSSGFNDQASSPDQGLMSRSGSIIGSRSGSDSNIDQASSQFGSSSASGARPSKKRPSSEGKVADSSLRIHVGLLDKMMMLAGELVLTRNQILQEESLESDGRFHGVFRELSTITSELQGCIMQSRMQPISTIWKQMPRIVRDVALGAFKQVHLEMEGGNAELDKTIIEAIRDPLMHVLRNSVDHGIELPELRAAIGKPAEGRIWMRAYHAGGQINIDIEDDGAGIDVQAIRRKALDQNLVAPSQVEHMSEQALLSLIFQPGFSTTTKITKLSGRGVGLDVVKSNIEKLGGAIHVQTVLGEGTAFTLRIPLTLAIVQALIVEAAGDYYVVPQSRIVELIRLRGEQADVVLDASIGVPDFRFRGRLLPILDLRDLFELESRESDSSSSDITLIVLNVHDRHFGLVVDRVIDNQEVVIKPLWQPLRTIPSYAGATQLADGTVALILDPVGLAKLGGLVPDRNEPEPVDAPIETDASVAPRILLARFNHGDRFALPADGLKRIEEVTSSQIKQLNGQNMMEYDGGIVRVIDLASLMGRGSSHSRRATNANDSNSEMTHVALYHLRDETVGLTVGPVVDIVQRSLDVQGQATRAHVQFTTMIDGELVELLDVDGIIGSLEARSPDEQTIASTGE